MTIHSLLHKLQLAKYLQNSEKLVNITEEGNEKPELWEEVKKGDKTIHSAYNELKKEEKKNLFLF
jgi:hypothetical protein